MFMKKRSWNQYEHIHILVIMEFPYCFQKFCEISESNYKEFLNYDGICKDYQIHDEMSMKKT